MPLIRLNDTPERKKFRENNLPKVPYTQSILVPAIKELLNDALIQTLRAEIELYKAYPKDNADFDIKKFNPTNSKTCFMGLGFGQESTGWSDADLAQYRKAVGTIDHAEWGKCTVLEIWAADHFRRHPDMVTGVFKYCFGTRKTLPNLYFESVPFIITELTGITEPTEEDKKRAMQAYMENYNSIRAGFDLPLVREFNDDMQRDFDIQWEAQLKYGNKRDT